MTGSKRCVIRETAPTGRPRLRSRVPLSIYLSIFLSIYLPIHPSTVSIYLRQGLLRVGERPVDLLAQVQRDCGVNDLYIGDLS